MKNIEKKRDRGQSAVRKILREHVVLYERAKRPESHFGRYFYYSVLRGTNGPFFFCLRVGYRYKNHRAYE